MKVLLIRAQERLSIHGQSLLSQKDGKYLLYRVKNINEPSHDEYCRAAQKLLDLKEGYDKISYYNYMNTPVCFVRENIQLILGELKNILSCIVGKMLCVILKDLMSIICMAYIQIMNWK